MSVSLPNEVSSLLHRVGAASLVDAMGRRYSHRCHVLDLVSPSGGSVLFGPVVTLAFAPHREDLPRRDFASLFYEAIESGSEGKVLVLASGGHPEVSLGGGTKLSRVANHRLAGVLADGRLRDFEELAGYDFVTYCRGETSKAGGGTVMPLAAGIPLIFDGVTVLPGDYAYAGPGGAVFIPASDVREVLEEAAEIEAEDARFMERIKGEDPDRVREQGSPEG